MAEDIKAKFTVKDRYRESRERARAAIAMIGPETKRIELRAKLAMQYSEELKELGVELHSEHTLHYLTYLESKLKLQRVDNELALRYKRLTSLQLIREMNA